MASDTQPHGQEDDLTTTIAAAATIPITNNNNNNNNSSSNSNNNDSDNISTSNHARHPPNTHLMAAPLLQHNSTASNTPDAPGHEFILNHSESQGMLVTSPLMSEATLPGEHQQPPSASSAPIVVSASTSAPASVSASAAASATAHNNAGTLDTTDNTHDRRPSGGSHSNGYLSRTNSGTNYIRRSPQMTSSAVHSSSGQYQLSVATFHKRNQDTNSFRTGQQFLIKLDLKSAEPFKSPMSLILPRRMIQGQQKTRQSDLPSGTATDGAAAASTGLVSPLMSSPIIQEPAGTASSQDGPGELTGDPETHFYLEVTVHLTSSEAIVQACPECCHKVEGKVRKPSNGPGAPAKTHGASEQVDPGQILQFCVFEHVVDFTSGTSTVMAKVLCSSTHHDKRGNNDRYFFKFSLMQYLNGQKIHIGSCRTKDILFTGNHKNKSMASFSEDKVETKPKIGRAEDESILSTPGSMVMGQTFTEEPDSIAEDALEKPYHHDSPMQSTHDRRSASTPHHRSFSSYGSSQPHHSGEHIPRIQEPSSGMDVDSPRSRHSIDKESYSSHGSRSPLPPAQASGAAYGSHSSTVSDYRLSSGPAFTPIKSKSWNDTLITPKITRIIPDVGDMLGGTEVTIFGSGFRAGLVPYFDSLPASNVTVLHSDVMTCRTPPRIQAAVASVGFLSKRSSGSGRIAPGAQYSYADKLGLGLAELAAEIVAMERDDYDEPYPQAGSGAGLGHPNYDATERSEQRLGGLGDLRSRATRVVRRGSTRRDSSDITSQSRSNSNGSRLNPMAESPRRRSSHSPMGHDQSLDDEELERLVTEMMSLGVTQSVVPAAQTCKALESAILNIVRGTEDIHHISMQNDQRHTLLHLAVLLEMNDLVEYLLKEKIEVNAADWNGFTALHYAAWTDQTDMYEILVGHGASAEALNCHQALPRHLFAGVPGTPQEFVTMYHPKPGQALETGSSFDRYPSGGRASLDNLKDDILEQYSRAKKARGSSGNMYVKSSSGDSISKAPAPMDHHRDPSHSHESTHSVHRQPPRHLVSSPPLLPQTQGHLRPAPHTMQSLPHPQAPRSPSPLRESFAGPYTQPHASASASSSGNNSSSFTRRYLHPVDNPPSRTGSLPSIRLERDHRESPHQHSPSYHHQQQHHQQHHHHNVGSPSSSPSAAMTGAPSSPMHHQQGSSHSRYPSSPSSYDHVQHSPQQYDSHPEERRSDRMLPSFGLNLPVPFPYQGDSSRGPSPGHHESGEGGHHGPKPVEAGQKRPGSTYHGSSHDGPMVKSPRTFDGPIRTKGGDHHEYDQQGPPLPMDGNRSAPANAEVSRPSNTGTDLENDIRDGSEDSGKSNRRTSQASHTCPHPNCNKSFTRPFNLRAHMRVHTAERPYKCDTCALAFSRLHDRNRHAKLHTGIKPFECSFCHHQFIRPDALRRHLGRGGGTGCGQKIAATAAADGQKAGGGATNSASSSTDSAPAPATTNFTTATTTTAAATSGTTTTATTAITNSATSHGENKTPVNNGASSRSSSGSSVRSQASLSSISSSLTAVSFSASNDWSRHSRLSTDPSGSKMMELDEEDSRDRSHHVPQQHRHHHQQQQPHPHPPRSPLGIISDGRRYASPTGTDHDEDMRSVDGEDHHAEPAGMNDKQHTTRHLSPVPYDHDDRRDHHHHYPLQQQQQHNQHHHHHHRAERDEQEQQQQPAPTATAASS